MEVFDKFPALGATHAQSLWPEADFKVFNFSFDFLYFDPMEENNLFSCSPLHFFVGPKSIVKRIAITTRANRQPAIFLMAPPGMRVYPGGRLRMWVSVSICGAALRRACLSPFILVCVGGCFLACGLLPLLASAKVQKICASYVLDYIFPNFFRPFHFAPLHFGHWRVFDKVKVHIVWLSHVHTAHTRTPPAIRWRID